MYIFLYLSVCVFAFVQVHLVVALAFVIMNPLVFEVCWIIFQHLTVNEIMRFACVNKETYEKVLAKLNLHGTITYQKDDGHDCIMWDTLFRNVIEPVTKIKDIRFRLFKPENPILDANYAPMARFFFEFSQGSCKLRGVHLEEVDFVHCDSTLLEWLEKQTDLTHFSLVRPRNMHTTYIMQAMNLLTRANEHMVELTVQNATLDPTQVRTVCFMCGNLPNLKVLNLSENILTEEDKKEIKSFKTSDESFFECFPKPEMKL